MIQTKIKQFYSAISQDIEKIWDEEIIPCLKTYITIPNVSPHYDADWESKNAMQQAMALLKTWCEQHPVAGMQIEILKEPGRTPLLWIEVPGQIAETALLYGHMDKQPEMVGWDADLGPWQPVLKDDKLYGRGGADDGYSVFMHLSALALLQRYEIPHARCVIIIEASEESGSIDLPFYIERLRERIGQPNFIICLDSGCANYQQMWSTTSLRGLLNGILTIDVLKEGMHSGVATGVVPTVFDVLRLLLDRIEDSLSGLIKLPQLFVAIPEQRLQQARDIKEILGAQLLADYPFVEQTQPINTDVAELLLNRTWRPGLTITGMDGVPPLQKAGSVMLPRLAVKLSFRLPPLCDPQQAGDAIRRALTENPPYSAKVEFNIQEAMPGWHAPLLSDWLAQANENASQLFFAQPAAYMGEGGSIPFMAMLGDMFPQAQFLITGVLGPHSNAHGPNEFLHIPMAKKLTGCIMMVLAAHHEHYK